MSAHVVPKKRVLAPGLGNFRRGNNPCATSQGELRQQTDWKYYLS